MLIYWKDLYCFEIYKLNELEFMLHEKFSYKDSQDKF